MDLFLVLLELGCSFLKLFTSEILILSEWERSGCEASVADIDFLCMYCSIFFLDVDLDILM